MYTREYDRIYRFLRRRSRSAEDAEDATQEVFLRAAEHLGRTGKPDGEGTPVTAWLYTVARNNLIDEARRRSRRPDLVSLDAVGELPSTTQFEYGPAVARVIRDAYRGLPATQRELVGLRLLQGRSFREIATKLDIDEAACKMRFVRALRSMQAHLEREGLEP